MQSFMSCRQAASGGSLANSAENVSRAPARKANHYRYACAQVTTGTTQRRPSQPCAPHYRTPLGQALAAATQGASVPEGDATAHLPFSSFVSVRCQCAVLRSAWSAASPTSRIDDGRIVRIRRRQVGRSRRRRYRRHIRTVIRREPGWWTWDGTDMGPASLGEKLHRPAGQNQQPRIEALF